MAETIRASVDEQAIPEICPRLARLIAYLGREYTAIAGREVSPEDILLAAKIVKHLRPLFAGNLLHEFVRLRAFLREHRGKMVRLYRMYQIHVLCSEDVKKVFFNPVAPLIFYLLETRRWELLAGWEDAYPFRILQDLALIWGKPFTFD
ncbi:hypothetical protein EDD75_0363 [Thermodesulfitimonas autotrophica]|uniref:Uncharacterized protein n=1 Tax=Thermodesulfitimonas autotrophica TaxID=1894989 RepID=A0A3N5AWE0_9THEO|nr:hypothetical protein [Thermodesulfitimonas autotrophica]RPF49546.1 hypothetical protein EDD75_0363 [Thermodesulfitimonas autotrophica]